MKAVAPEPMKRFQPNLTEIFAVARPRTDWVLRIVGAKVKVTENIVQKCIFTTSPSRA